MGGGSNIKGESLLCQLHFRSAHKTPKNASAEFARSFRNSIMGGGSNIEGESLLCQLRF